MSTKLTKAYNPKEVEDKIYKTWLDSGFFSPEALSSVASAKENRFTKRKFVTCIAPPNITGELHMGHALELTLQDIIVRMKRMQGYKTLWLPGTDHAGIGAQNVVEKQLAKEGLSRHNLGREKFLERMWQWKEKYGNAILEQLKKLGLSVDWARTKFTMDPEYQEAVSAAFLHYYRKGWIYQGERVVNWCIRCATAISDLEVNYVSEKGKIYYIKYGPFTLATTRPETKLGDTALAVHPSDLRYKNFVGKEMEIESVDNSIPADQPVQKKKIKILVVADESVDPKFGTGIIKVTPAHDLTDSEIGQRHNLKSIKIIDEQGRMNEGAGIRYQGLKVNQAREKIVEDLQTLSLIEKVEDYEHNVSRCDRCNSVVEPLPSKQWFLKMKDLAKLALKAVKKGKVKIHPKRWVAPYENWLKNIRDWNISRQLWWGHQLPVYFCRNKQAELKVDQFIISKEKPGKCPFCKEYDMIQSEDVLDTWFSSALWPFATLGWPLLRQGCFLRRSGYGGRVGGQAAKSDFKEYYPTDFITSDRGILFLWQVRMIFSGLEFTGKTPFKDVYIHATVLTKDGKRMSKSLGTGVNPLKLIEKYGTDALRFGLASQTTGLQDLRFGEDLLVMGKKFANKLWNIARYTMLKLGENYEWQEKTPKNEISKKMQEIAKLTTESIEKYEFAEAANRLYHFIWHKIADKFIEESKDRDDQETKDTLAYLLLTSLKLIHPFMPFVTEEIWSKLPLKNKKLLLVESWPLSGY